jgi:hypothetical protein
MVKLYIIRPSISMPYIGTKNVKYFKQTGIYNVQIVDIQQLSYIKCEVKKASGYRRRVERKIVIICCTYLVLYPNTSWQHFSTEN